MIINFKIKIIHFHYFSQQHVYSKYRFIHQTRVDKKTQTVSETHKGKLFKLVEKKIFLVESANYHVKNGVVFGNYTFRTIAIESFSDNHGAVPLPPPPSPQ